MGMGWVTVPKSRLGRDGRHGVGNFNIVTSLRAGFSRQRNGLEAKKNSVVTWVVMKKEGPQLRWGWCGDGWKIQLACHGVENESEGQIDCIAFSVTVFQGNTYMGTIAIKQLWIH